MNKTREACNGCNRKQLNSNGNGITKKFSPYGNGHINMESKKSQLNSKVLKSNNSAINEPSHNQSMNNGTNNNIPYPEDLGPLKSVFTTYLLWFTCGLFGGHHLYLRRDRQAFVWWCTLGMFLKL